MKKPLRRRGLPLLLAAALLLGLFPAAAFAMDGGNGSNGLDLTNAADDATFTCGDGTAHWQKITGDPDISNTYNLTLNNVTIDGPVILPVGDENDYATYTTVNIIISGENIISAEGVPLQGGDSVYLMEDEPAEGNATNSLLLDNEMQGVVSDVDGIVAHRPKVERYLEISDGTNLVQGGAFPGADENPSITYISKQQSTLKCTYGKIPDGKYVLTVYEGTGAGTYAAGETVPISCPDEISMETGEAGETVKCPFIKWRHSNDEAGSVENPYRTDTAFTMGEGHSSVEANYLQERWGCLVTYKSNYKGGSRDVLDGPFEPASTDTPALSGDIFDAPTGKIFAGWAESANGAVKYQGGDFIILPQKDPVQEEMIVYNLYAIWNDSPYSVTYKANYNGGPQDITDPNPYQIGDTVTVRDSNLFTAPENMRFAGWSTKADSVKGEYKGGETFQMEDKDVTLYAIWERVYALTYTPNFDDSTQNDISAGPFAAGDPVTALESDAFAPPADMIFAGWAESKDGPILYLAGSPFPMPSRDLKLYAVWLGAGETPTYSVTYKPNFAGSTEEDKVTGPFAAGDPVTTLESDAFQASSGKTFSGWAESADGAVKYRAGETFQMPELPVVLYAVWKNKSSGSNPGPSTYSVVYNSNYEKGPSEVRDPGHRSGDKVTVKEGSIFQAPEGMTFAGWAESKDGTVKFLGGDTFQMPAKTVTLYALWQEKPGKGDPGPLPALNKEDHIAYLEGFPDGTVGPEALITREQTAAIFYRLLVEATRTHYHSTASPFLDVTNNRWSAEAIATMANAGILKGLPDGTYAPGSPITRAEFAAIAARFSSDSYSGPHLFNDIAGHWAADEINRAAHKGWVKGGKDGRYRPDDYITRAEAAALINRVLERAPQTAEDLLPGMKTFPDNANTQAWFYLDLQEAANGHDYERKADGVHETWTELNENH